MGVGRDMGYYRYTDDAGGHWRVRIDKAQGDNADLGFAAVNGADPYLEASRMRYINLLDPATGNKRRVHVGATSADAWAPAAFTIDLAEIGTATLTTYTRTSRRGEKINTATVVYNT